MLDLLDNDVFDDYILAEHEERTRERKELDEILVKLRSRKILKLGFNEWQRLKDQYNEVARAHNQKFYGVTGD